MTQQIIRLAHNAVHAKLLDAEPQLKREIASMLSYRVAGAEHSDAFKGHRWDGRSSFFDFPTSTFPAGFVHPVHSFLVKKGYRVQLVRKAVPEPLGPSVKECDATIDSFGGDPRYSYQVDTIERLERYGMMIARCATGAGKSRIARLAFARIKRPTLFLTTRSVLMYQMAESFENLDGRKVGILGDGDFTPRKGINCGMVQTIAARLKNEATREQMLNILSVFEMVILEEAHESGGNEYYEILSACKNAHYRLALTATPFMRQDEEANMRLMAVAGPIGIEVTEEQLINSGILATPYFKIVPTAPVPKVKRTSSWLRAYEYGIIKNEGRNGHIVFEVKRATAMNLPAMVLIQRKEHGQILEKMMTAAGIRAKFIFGENSQDERKKALKQLGNGELQCLIGSTILDVGVDVPSVGLVVLAGGGKAEVAHRQRIGRGLRAKKKGPNVALVVDFDDSINSHLKEHALTRENILRTTPGFAERILPPGADFDFKKLGLM